jgi:predicted phage tail protein
MKVVKVYGALRKRLGRCRFEFEAATPAQALKALCVNFPGLDKWLIDSEKDGVGYRVMVGKERVADDLNVLAMPWSEQEVFSITPVIAGAGGVGRIVLGAALITTAILVPGLGTTLGTVGIFGSTFGVVSAGIGAIGAGLVLGGVADIISPQPSLDSGLDEAVQLESFTFSNVVNTSKQGLPVPIAYGRVFVGSSVISSGLDVDQKRT